MSDARRYDYTTAPGFIQDAAGEDNGHVRLANHRNNIHHEMRAFTTAALTLAKASGSNPEQATNDKFGKQLTELMAIVHAPTQESSALGYNS